MFWFILQVSRAPARPRRKFLRFLRPWPVLSSADLQARKTTQGVEHPSRFCAMLSVQHELTFLCGCHSSDSLACLGRHHWCGRCVPASLVPDLREKGSGATNGETHAHAVIYFLFLFAPDFLSGQMHILSSGLSLDDSLSTARLAAALDNFDFLQRVSGFLFFNFCSASAQAFPPRNTDTRIEIHRPWENMLDFPSQNPAISKPPKVSLTKCLFKPGSRSAIAASTMRHSSAIKYGGSRNSDSDDEGLEKQSIKRPKLSNNDPDGPV